MLLEILEETHVDRFGRTSKHNVFRFRCDVCGNEWNRRGSKSRMLSRKTNTCSKKCKSAACKTDGVTAKLRHETCLARYGAENPFACDSIKSKIRETMLERYGFEHALQVDEFMKKVNETMLEKYGVLNSGQSSEIQAKIRATMLERHGVAYPMQMDSVKEALEKGCIEKFGAPRILQSEAGREKFKESLLIKHGADHPQRSKEIREKTKQTCLVRYGTDNFSKSDLFANMTFSMGCHKSGHTKFKDRDIWYRSSYEERFLKWLVARGDVDDLKCNIAVNYFFEDKVHKYFIDFGVVYTNGRKILYEVKNEYAAQSAKNIAKFESVQSNLINLGYDSFEIVTEKTLKNMGA